MAATGRGKSLVSRMGRPVKPVATRRHRTVEVDIEELERLLTLMLAIRLDYYGCHTEVPTSAKEAKRFSERMGRWTVEMIAQEVRLGHYLPRRPVTGEGFLAAAAKQLIAEKQK